MPADPTTTIIPEVYDMFSEHFRKSQEPLLRASNSTRYEIRHNGVPVGLLSSSVQFKSQHFILHFAISTENLRYQNLDETTIL